MKTKGFQSRDVAIMGLLIALKVVLMGALSIETPFFRIGFAFVPTVIAALAYGPIGATTVGVLADLLNFFLFQKGYPFHPGFTISAAVAGILYGLILYKKPLTLKRFFIAALTVGVIVNIGMNSFWIKILYDQAFWAFLPGRIIENLITVFVETAILYGASKNRSIRRLLRNYPIVWED